MTQYDPALLAKKLGLLRAGYLLHLSESVKTLGVYEQSCCGGTLSEEMRASLIGIVHQLAGSGGTYGFPSISENAHTFEVLLRSDSPPLQNELSQKIRSLSLICYEAMDLLAQKRRDEARQMSDANSSAVQGEKPLVVAIDDDPMIRAAMEILLENKVQMIAGSNAGDALRLMRELKPALVLLDDIMPGGITGLSLLEKIKEDDELSKIPVIMVTASSNKSEVVRGLKAGAIDYITKPFTPEVLVETVMNFFARKQSHVFLNLQNSSLQNELQERLVELNCCVSCLDLKAIDYETTQYENGILVADEASMSPVQVHELLSKNPSVQFLHLSPSKYIEEDATPNPQLTRIAQTNSKDDIVKAIGFIISKQRERTRLGALSTGEKNDSK